MPDFDPEDCDHLPFSAVLALIGMLLFVWGFLWFLLWVADAYPNASRAVASVLLFVLVIGFFVGLYLDEEK